MSIVHGGPVPRFLSPLMFEALFSDLSKMVVSVKDVYDPELQSSLQALLNSTSPREASQLIKEGTLPTILDLAGTLAPVQALSDIGNIVDSTTRWFVIGRAMPALESFQKGLSALGVLEVIKTHPDALRSVFCHAPEEITAEAFESLFAVISSPVGSKKVVTESLVLSRWRDYLQDIEDGEVSDKLNDILFFTTGCNVLPPHLNFCTMQENMVNQGFHQLILAQAPFAYQWYTPRVTASKLT